MDDIAQGIAGETLERIVSMPVLDPDEVERLLHVVHDATGERVNLVPSVMRLGPDDDVYLLGAGLEEGQVTVRIDVPSLGVVRSFDVAGGMRLLEQALRDLPYAEIVRGERPFVVSVRLQPQLLPLRAEWLSAAQALAAAAPRPNA